MIAKKNCRCKITSQKVINWNKGCSHYQYCFSNLFWISARFFTTFTSLMYVVKTLWIVTKEPILFDKEFQSHDFYYIPNNWIDRACKKTPRSSSNLFNFDVTAVVFYWHLHLSTHIKSSFFYISHAQCCLFNRMNFYSNCDQSSLINWTNPTLELLNIYFFISWNICLSKLTTDKNVKCILERYLHWSWKLP